MKENTETQRHMRCILEFVHRNPGKWFQLDFINQHMVLNWGSTAVAAHALTRLGLLNLKHSNVGKKNKPKTIVRVEDKEAILSQSLKKLDKLMKEITLEDITHHLDWRKVVAATDNDRIDWRVFELSFIKRTRVGFDTFAKNNLDMLLDAPAWVQKSFNEKWERLYGGKINPLLKAKEKIFLDNMAPLPPAPPEAIVHDEPAKVAEFKIVEDSWITHIFKVIANVLTRRISVRITLE